MRGQTVWPVLVAGLLTVGAMTVAKQARAISDQDIVTALEAMGDLAAAYPLAVTVAKADGSYRAWRGVAVKYAALDKNGSAYLGAWQAALRQNTEPAFEDFLKLRPASPLNAVAINAVFRLKRESDTIHGYRAFIDRYPGSVEAVEALLRIHEIAFERARQENKVEVFDAFITAFPLAAQAVEANRLAERLQRATIDREVGTSDDLANGDKRDRIARRLFNDAREAEKASRLEIAGRNLALLADPRFRDTKAYTEWLDRQERLDFQKVLLDQQERVRVSIESMGRAVTAGLREVRSEIRAGTVDLRAAIESHNRDIRRAIAAQGEELRRYADASTAAMGKALSGQMSAVASSIQAQTMVMERASREAGWQQERLFRQAQEQADERARNERRCADHYARNGSWWFSGCD